MIFWSLGLIFCSLGADTLEAWADILEPCCADMLGADILEPWG